MRPVTSPSGDSYRSSHHSRHHATPHCKPKFVLLHGSELPSSAMRVINKVFDDRKMRSKVIDASRLPALQAVSQVTACMRPRDHLLISAHGSVDSPSSDGSPATHLIQLAKEGDLVPTKTLLASLVNQLGTATAHASRSNRELPFIYLFSCGAGSLRDEISPDSEIWKRANLMIFAGKRSTSMHSSAKSFTGAVTYVDHCQRNNEPVEPMKLLFLAGVNRGDSVTFMGGELSAPLVWRAPKSIKDQSNIWNLRGNPEDISRFGQTTGTLLPEEFDCLPQASPLEVLYNRMQRNDTERARAMLEKQPELANMTTVSGTSPITDAIICGSSTFVRMLLEAGADSNTSSDNGDTPLIVAMCNPKRAPKIEDVELLIRHGADPNRQNEDGVTALIAACNAGHTKGAAALLKGGANPNLLTTQQRTSAIGIAAVQGNAAAMTLLIAHGADLEVTDRADATPLMLAIQSSDEECLRILLKAGANPNAQDAEGATALMRAVEKADADKVQLLLDHGARLDLRNKRGDHCLDLASVGPNTDILKQLLAAGAGPLAGLNRALVNRAFAHGRVANANLLDQALEATEPSVHF